MSSITYIVQLESSEGYVKFGRTRSPRTRIAQLATGTPWPLRLVCLIALDVEADLKRTFAKDKVRGEWFRPTLELQAWIDRASSEGKLTRQVEVDQSYINAVIKPRIREYLNGRDPANNGAGDLVCRIFADMLPTLAGREKELAAATKGHVSETLAKGFGPTNEVGVLQMPDEGAGLSPAALTSRQVA